MSHFKKLYNELYLFDILVKSDISPLFAMVKIFILMVGLVKTFTTSI